MGISELLIALLAIFAAAKIFGELAERIGQPAVLGEMVGGIVIGVSGLHLIDAHDPLLHVLSELGVILLLFLIGLETDIRRLLSVGGASLAVAAAGVVLPFAAGYGVGMWLNYPTTLSVFLGAALIKQRPDAKEGDFFIKAIQRTGPSDRPRSCVRSHASDGRKGSTWRN